MTTKIFITGWVYRQTHDVKLTVLVLLICFSLKYYTVSLAATAGTSISSFVLLNVGLEKYLFIVFQLYILIITPLWKTFLWKKKVRIKGPWDIVHLKQEDYY